MNDCKSLLMSLTLAKEKSLLFLIYNREYGNVMLMVKITSEQKNYL